MPSTHIKTLRCTGISVCTPCLYHTLLSSYCFNRAAGAGQLETARLLVEEGRVTVDPRDAQDATPLLLAVQRGAQAVALYLVSKGGDLEV